MLSSSLRLTLKRIFVTNWRTTFCALLIFTAIGLKVLGKIDNSDMVAIMAVATGSGFLLSKDGTQGEQRVAPENTQADAPA